MLLENPKEGPVSDSDEASGSHRLAGARPWSGCGPFFGSVKEKSNRSWGQGACPLGLPPPTGGERGSPSQFPRQFKKTRRRFLQSHFFCRAIFLSFYFLFELSVPTRHGDIPSGTATFIIPD
jgi:hypothetical protein